MLIHFIFTLFLGASWNFCFWSRVLLHVPVTSLLVMERKRHNDEMILASSLFTGLALAMVLELSVYINMKAKAKLFLKTKQIEQ